MEKFVIDGGVPLRGTVTPAGNKNGALPILAASVLTTEEIVVRNVPRIRDVEAMLRVLRGIGVTVEWRDDNEVCLCAADVDPQAHIDREHATRIRASFLLAGPLLARFGHAEMPPPGGDVIGRRRLDPHLDAFRSLGATFVNERDILLRAPDGRLRAGEVFMDEPSVMATENAVMAAALTSGTTVIGNAACEPHVQDLARMLVKMGADIRGIGSNVLTITGRDALGGCTHDVGPDHIEIGSFIALAGVTGGDLRIKDTEPEDLRMIRLIFERLGLRTELDGADVLVPGEQSLITKRDVGEFKAKIQDGPWPAFPADLTSIAIALATQCSGSVLVHEWMFENRMIFTDKLVSMGADIVLCDPHRAIVTGPSRLRGERLSSPDIRAGMAMLIAALSAEGQSEIQNIREIDRGYERIDERLRELRALTETLRGVFERHGYGEVYTPAIEYESVMTRAPGSSVSPAYRVFDDHGDVLALRSDMTVPIARLVATRYPTADPPLRLCYVAHAYRAVRPHRGQMREFLQAGIELVGAPGPEGTAEALTVLCGALDAVGLTRYRVGLGDASLYPRLMAAFDVPEEAGGRMLEELGRKDLVGLEREVEELGLPPDAADLLVRVPQMRGGAELLGAERGPVADALGNLRSVLDLLEPRVAERVIFDLGLARGLGYYSGAVFDVYDPALGAPLGGGGRYDDLLGRFGRDLPAVGFALGVERLHAALSGEEHAGL